MDTHNRNPHQIIETAMLGSCAFNAARYFYAHCAGSLRVWAPLAMMFWVGFKVITMCLWGFPWMPVVFEALLKKNRPTRFRTFLQGAPVWDPRFGICLLSFNSSKSKRTRSLHPNPKSSLDALCLTRLGVGNMYTVDPMDIAIYYK